MRTQPSSIREYIAVAVLLFLTGGESVTAAGQPHNNSVNTQYGNSLSFVACPVYRDVDQGIKSGCWLAVDPATGIRFDITRGRSKPQWGRQVLVEGIVADEQDVCGGVVLRPVRISVLPGYCNKHMLPPEGFKGRKFELPGEVMQQLWVPRPVPEPPYGTQRYIIFFDFNSSFPLYQYSELILQKAAIYAKASRPKLIRVTGYAATEDYVVSDNHLKENLAVAESRAKKMGLALQRLGVPKSIIKVTWKGNSEPVQGGDEGLQEPSRRRVEIMLEF